MTSRAMSRAVRNIVLGRPEDRAACQVFPGVGTQDLPEITAVYGQKSPCVPNWLSFVAPVDLGHKREYPGLIPFHRGRPGRGSASDDPSRVCGQRSEFDSGEKAAWAWRSCPRGPNRSHPKPPLGFLETVQFLGGGCLPARLTCGRRTSPPSCPATTPCRRRRGSRGAYAPGRRWPCRCVRPGPGKGNRSPTGSARARTP